MRVDTYALRLPPLSGWQGAAVSLIIGGIAALGHVPWSLPILTVVAFSAAALICATRVRWADSATAGLMFGFGYFLISLHWISEPFLVDSPRHGWMAPFAVFFLCLGLAGFWAAAFGIARAIGTGVASRAIALVLTITASGAIREVAFTGFPWALPAYIWTETPVAQIASLIGPHGLTALTVAIAISPLATGSRRLSIVLAVLALAGCWAYGTLRLAEEMPTREGAAKIRLVHPNVPQDRKWEEDAVDEYFSRQLQLTEIQSEIRPDIVVWPETAATFWLHQEDGEFDEIARAAKGATVVFGIRRFENGRYYNSLIALDKFGRVDAVYDKRHLVPFGEYIPFGGLLSRIGIKGLASEEGGGFSSGERSAVIELGSAGRMLALICFEAIFPREIRNHPRPDSLLQISNDGWFGGSAGAEQHYSQARMRTIELGLPLVRVANAGFSAAVDGRGRVVAALTPTEQGILDVELPASEPPTLYARVGDVPVFVIWLVVAGVLIGRRIRFQH